MTPTIQVGSILMNDAPQLARVLRVESEPYSGNWSVLRNSDSKALDRDLRAAGWEYFFLAAEVKVMFLGALGAQRIRSAVKRILKKVKSQDFNCLEVTGIVAKRFWGMPYATVTAHSRHIQQSEHLDDIETRRAARRAAEWARG
jgi:hypothetical protein